MILGGRNQAPLNADQIRRVVNTFLGLDANVNVRYEEQAQTAFHVVEVENGQNYGEIVFGPDIYPGAAIVDPNASLSLDAAAAHELAHYYRWRDLRALPAGALSPIDEALTSLEAIQRYEGSLKAHDVRQLISDAVQRIVLYMNSLQDHQ